MEEREKQKIGSGLTNGSLLQRGFLYVACRLPCRGHLLLLTIILFLLSPHQVGVASCLPSKDDERSGKTNRVLPQNRLSPTDGSEDRSAAEKAPPDTHEGIVADTLFWAPEIVVEAERIKVEDELFKRSGFVASIDLTEGRAYVEDVAAILSRIVGVRIRQYGGLGSFATVSIRGSSSNQVEIYMDGIPLNNAFLGTIDLADLPVGDLKRIEVYRGFSPPHLGSSPIGGVVNLVTRGDEEWETGGILSHLETRATLGSYGTRRYLLSLWSKIWRLKMHYHASYLESRGDFTYLDDRSTPENPFDDRETSRLNNDFTLWNMLGQAALDLPGFSSASLNHEFALREGGVPGVGSNQSETARSERTRHITYLKLKPRPLLAQRLHTEGALFHSWTADRFNNPSDITLAKQKTDNRITINGGNIRTRIFVPRVPLSLELFVEGRKERFHPVSFLPAPSEGPDRLRSSTALAISSDLSLLKSTLILTVARRFERYVNEFYDEPMFPWLPPTPQGKVRHSEQTPHLGFRWHAAPYMTIKGNWGRYYRLPTFLELFGNLGSVTGSPDLEPERGMNRDIGLILSAKKLWILRQLFVEAVYLHNDVENLILFFPNSQYTSRPENIGSASIRGCEILTSCTIGGLISLSGSYSYLDGRDTSPIPYYHGNRLVGRPVHASTFEIAWTGKRWTAAYELHYIGSNYLDQANMKEVPSREIHGLSLHLGTLWHRFSLTLEGRNLGGNQLSDVNGFPLPGRSFYSTLNVQM